MAEPLTKTFRLWRARKTEENKGPVGPPHEREPLPVHRRPQTRVHAPRKLRP